MAILKNTKFSNIAPKFVELMTNENAQNYFANQTYEYPLKVVIAPKAKLKSLQQNQPIYWGETGNLFPRQYIEEG
jgi:iron(III) transport system substrate-binding protein